MALKQETAISILQAYRAKFDDVIDAYGTRKFNQATKSNNTDYKTKFKKHCHHIKQSIDSELEKSDQGIEINCQSIVNDIFKLQEQYEYYFHQTQERKANCCLFFKHSMNRSFLHLYNKHLSRVTHFVEKVIQSECASFISQKGNICEKAHVSTILNFICNQKTNIECLYCSRTTIGPTTSLRRSRGPSAEPNVTCAEERILDGARDRAACP